jgi:potassium efflux system protein
VPAAGQAAKAPGAEGKAAPAAEPAAVTPIPLAEMTARAEDAFAHAREVQDAATMDRTDESIAQDLRTLTREIDARVAETRKVLSRTSSIDTLQRIERPWARIARVLGDWSETLSERIADLEAERARLEATAAVWRATLEEARRSGAPPEAIRRIEELQAEIAKASEAIAREHSRALSVQNRIAIQQSRAGQVIAATRRARRDVENHLFVRDGPPIWAAVSEAGGGDGFAAESRGTLEAQWSAVRAYSERQPGSFMLHGIVFLALAATLLWLRTRVRKWVADEPPLAEVADVFDTPVAMALVLSIIGGFWIYPDAPMLWLAILGALVLIPAIIILRRLIEPDVRPVLYALVLFYFVDQVRTVAAPLELVPRLVFLGELLCAALVSGWLMMRLRRPAQPAGKAAPAETRRRKYVRRASAAAFVLAFAAAAANALGYVALSSLLGNALFNSAYVGLMLYALVEILDGLFLIALHGRPLILLASVRTHRMMLARRVRRFVEWVALGLWALYALQRLALRERLFELARNALGAEAALGSLRISLGDVLAFVVVVWASFLVSRFVRFLLEEEVYPRFTLARGLPYAISTTLHYVLVVAGFLAAVSALGFDMTKLTILAGAFTVGVGFGLQNIFNNFVSGLILLFERPVQVGDVIQLDDNTQGLVERIGIRASVVRVSSGPEVIVPNGKLISERVINWTLHGRRRSVEIPVAVVSGSDWKKGLAIMERVGAMHPLVLKAPPPRALITRMGPDWWVLDLRIWTDRPEDWMEIRSEVAVAAGEALKAEGIAVK